MPNKENLQKAQKTKNNEYFTYYIDIEKELIHYWKFLKNKKILCPFDNKNSNFVKYLQDKKEYIKYKSLTYWEYKELDEHDYNDYDVIITNPPFSKIRKFYEILYESKKEFLIAGPNMFLTYYVVIEKYVNNEIRFGFNEINNFLDISGQNKLVKVYWYTNFKINRVLEPWILTKKYDEKVNKTYTSYEKYMKIINVDKMRDIPKDYNGLIGVPPSFLFHYDKRQFKVLGIISPFINERKTFTRILIIKR